MKPSWTKQEDERLVFLRKCGYTFDQLSILMGNKFNKKFTKNSCIGRYHRLVK